MRDLSHLPGVNQFLFLFGLEVEGLEAFTARKLSKKETIENKKESLFLWIIMFAAIYLSFVLHLHSRGLGIEHCDWSILPLLLPTPTKQFSLDRK